MQTQAEIIIKKSYKDKMTQVCLPLYFFYGNFSVIKNIHFPFPRYNSV